MCCFSCIHDLYYFGEYVFVVLYCRGSGCCHLSSVLAGLAKQYLTHTLQHSIKHIHYSLKGLELSQALPTGLETPPPPFVSLLKLMFESCKNTDVKYTAILTVCDVMMAAGVKGQKHANRNVCTFSGQPVSSLGVPFNQLSVYNREAVKASEPVYSLITQTTISLYNTAVTGTAVTRHKDTA